MPTSIVFAADGCMVFQYSEENYTQSHASDCLSFRSLDQDKDGVPDYVANQLYGPTLFPFDDDLNNNGLPDLIDKNPQGFKSPIQEELWNQFGVLSPTQSGKSFEKVWSAMRDILSVLGINRESHSLHRFRYLKPLNEMDSIRAHAYYIEPAHTIVFDQKISKLSDKKLYSVLAHEVGHALLFSRLTALELKRLAQRQAGWTFDGLTRDLYDPGFLQGYNGSKSSGSAFPSEYSKTNAHEWFAEQVSKFVLSKLGHSPAVSSSSNEMTGYLTTLLKCKGKRHNLNACLSLSSLKN